jgi:peptidoglycan LD-endopeptidase LytH
LKGEIALLYRTWLLLLAILLIAIPCIPSQSYAEEDDEKQRLHLYKTVGAFTAVPWYYLAAVDRYERNVRNSRRDIPDVKEGISIYYSPDKWVGALNPNQEDTNPFSIQLFGGVGMDGNGDGKADRTDDEDVLYTFAYFLQAYGANEEDIKIGLWDYYQRDKTVSMIIGFAHIINQTGQISFDERRFPLPLHANYSYRSTWGDRRGFGGLRIHEGTDIFAGYGVPVRATTYGFIEMKGWNKFGGWRVGIRDMNNVYHYFAHLSGFEKGLEVGKIVKPGDVIGYVGSSGYGKPGTQGKFPPHLHYGTYRDNGISEWSFDPYPYLRTWERMERRSRR